MKDSKIVLHITQTFDGKEVKGKTKPFTLHRPSAQSGGEVIFHYMKANKQTIHLILDDGTDFLTSSRNGPVTLSEVELV